MKKHILIATAGMALMLGTALAKAQFVVRIGPPPPRPVEVVPPPPPEHRDWAWHAGFHEWDGHGYRWHPGYYVAPPRPYAHWVPGHWANRGGGYVWIEGHWR